jgi:hypothetical protein
MYEVNGERYSESSGLPQGEPFDAERIAKVHDLPPEPVLPPHWDARYITRTSRRGGGDAWLDGDKPKHAVNKARGALFANLLTDDMVADAAMRSGK